MKGTRKAWYDRGVALTMSYKKSLWGIADWCLEGEEHDPSGRICAKVTGYSVSHILNMRRTAREFPESVRRVEDLSWGAHLLLIQIPDLEERGKILDLAASEKWQQKKVQSHLAKHHPERVTRKRLGGPKERMVVCPSCSHVFPVKGHEVEE